GARVLWRWATFVKQVPQSRVRQLHIDAGDCTFTGYFTLVTQPGCVSRAVRRFLGKRTGRVPLEAGTDSWLSEPARAAIGDSSGNRDQLVTLPAPDEATTHDPELAEPLLAS